MKAAIMQPYIFPYIGYFQLISSADKFIVYDNIQFTKKGWINRNRILINGKDEYISFPLKKDSDYLNIDQRFVSDDFATESVKMLRKIEAAYRKAPQFEETFSIIRSIILRNEKNLFRYIYHSLKEISLYLEIKTEFIVSSSLNIDHNFRAEEKVIALCKAVGATEYINPIGGTGLYAKGNFIKNGMSLGFIKSEPITYNQFNNEFVSWLSIIDVLMFNPKKNVQEYLNAYTII